MPAMCTAMTYAEDPAWWWSRMCGGVIVITATIADCTMIIDARPSCTIGSRLMTTHDRLDRLDRLRAAGSRIDPADDRERIRTESEPDDGSGPERQNGREGNRTDAGIKTDVRSEPLPLRSQHRTEHRTERAEPDNSSNRPRTLSRARQGRRQRTAPATTPPAHRRTSPCRRAATTPSASVRRTQRPRHRTPR